MLSVLRTLALPAAAVAVLLVASCLGRQAPNGMPCSDHGDCTTDNPEGFAACVSGYCEDADCLVSGDCPRGTFCDSEGQDFLCKEGCQEDADCLAGQFCDENNSCQQSPCRSTILDCNFGEICNAGTGLCEEAQGDYCASCDPLFHEQSGLETFFDPCDDLIVGHPQCGGTGSFCLGGDGTGVEAYCAVACTESEDCPAGYQCSPITMNMPGCSEEIVSLGMACVATSCP